MVDNILLIVLASLVFFYRTFKYNYCSDDIPTYNATKEKYKDCWWKRLFWNIEGSIKVGQFRDHIITWILHTLVCVYIYIGFGANSVSLIAAFLFMVNPVNNQGSIWISGRGYVLPTLLLLLAVSYPTAAPVFVFLTAYFHTGFLTLLMFSVSPLYLYMILVSISWLFWSRRFHGLVKQKVKTEMFGEDKKVHPKKLILFFKTFGYYFALCFFPFRTAFYHAYMQSMAGNDMMKRRAYKIDKFFFIGLTSFIVMISYIATHLFTMESLALAWWICGIAPYCNLFRVQQEIAERYCYLPLVGFSYMLASFIHTNPAVVAMFLTMYATKLWFYMPAYKDDYFLSETARIVSRDSWFVWHIAAMKRWDTGALKEATTLWVMAKMISPHEFKVLYNIATCLKFLRNDKEAAEYLELAMQNVPEGQEKEIKKLYDDFKNGKAAIIL